ncbi:hypothetical protein [Streptomyces sp. NPDC049915]|uniref:hypothetical protein n=1 Tax=Streptomyces sp. NPDC049915 TaxID=3155510 RepID=UPI00342B4D90
MAVEQLPGEMREFVEYLDALLGRLDTADGWCGVFWQRDPDGMRACREGREMPPWDVVAALLQDLASRHGREAAAREAERARVLHAAAVAAYDARPGGREALADRLDVMLREQRYAAERRAVLTRTLARAATREEADALRLDLAWSDDDHERATARCAELRARMARLERGLPTQGMRGRGNGGPSRDDGPLGDALGQAGHVPVAPDAHAAALRAGEGGSWFAAGDAEGAGPVAARGAAAGGADFVAARGAGAGGADPVAATDAAAGAGHRAPVSTPHAGSLPGGREVTAPVGAAPHTGHGATASRPGRDARPAPSGPLPGPAPSALAPAPAVAAPAPHRLAETPAQPGAGPSTPPGVQAVSSAQPGPVPPPAAAAPGAEPSVRPAPPDATTRKRRRGGARFAGAVDEGDAPLLAEPAPVPAAGRAPRGARFAGAGEHAEAAPVAAPAPSAEPMDGADRRAVQGAVDRLARLRADGRTGDAHALLVELAHWPAARFPLLAAALHRAGLGADWTTLLWEAASLPAERLVAAADALVAAGRDADGEHILRQGVVRPAEEIGATVRTLHAGGRHRDVRALLGAYVRVRAPEEAARSAAPDPRLLAPLLLEAARGVSDERHWDLLHALRVAGLAH